MLVDTPPLTSSIPTSHIPDFNDRAHQLLPTADDFRLGIGHLARGVAVLTSSSESGERYGVTTTRLSVVSIEPPTLVVCVRRRSKLGTQLPRTRRFCANVLSSRQRRFAEAFAGGRGQLLDKVNTCRWTIGSSGSPILSDALASFECEVDLLYGYPSHMVVVGSVRNVAVSPEQLDPLVYSSGRLSSLNSSAVAPLNSDNAPTHLESL